MTCEYQGCNKAAVFEITFSDKARTVRTKVCETCIPFSVKNGADYRFVTRAIWPRPTVHQTI